jgi:ATP-binding cassette, subfamily C, bacterial CydD
MAANLLPPPSAGEGRGGGESSQPGSTRGAGTFAPPPQPSPARGEGEEAGKRPRERLDLRILRLDPLAARCVAAAVAAGLLATGAVVAQAALLSRVLAGVFVQHDRLGDVAGALVLLLLAALVRGLCLLAADVLGQRASGRVKRLLRRRLVSRLLELGPTFSRGERTGQLVTTAGEGVESLDAYLGQALPQLALAVLAPGLVLAVLLWSDPLSALAVLLIAPFVPVLTALIGARTKELVDRRWAQLGRMSAHFLDMLQGLPTLKLFGQSRAQLAGIEEVSRSYGRSSMDVLRVAFQSSLVLDLAATMGVALVAIEVGTRLLLRSLPFERAVFLLLLTPELFLPLRQLAVARHARLQGASAARRVFALLDAPPPARPAPGPGAAAPPRFEIRLEQVAYTPPGRDEPALHDVSLCLPRGCVTALTGPTGAGKTTVGALLLRFADPDAGAITVDGAPLSDLGPAAWRRLVAWCPQLPHLFHGTIADNIRWGRPEASPGDVERAARAALAGEFIRALPDGYATQVGEDGARLSGGQRRRIALARAFLLDRPVVILDEPTAHLDRRTGEAVREAVLRHCRGRTALLITHDERLARLADRVVVLERGRTLPAEVRR